MSVIKQFNKTKPECMVTFRLGKEIAKTANRINLAGDFNDWDIESIPMIRLKNGEYKASVNLQKGREYQFKYLIDGKEWVNEKEADKYIPNEFQSENSVVIL